MTRDWLPWLLLLLALVLAAAGWAVFAIVHAIWLYVVVIGQIGAAAP